MSILLGACSSSGGASPAPSGGDTDAGDTATAGATTDGTTGGAAMTIDAVGTTGGGTDILGAAAVPELQGEWSTGCIGIGLSDFYSLQTISVVGSRMRYEYGSYSDQECTTPIDLGALANNGTTLQQEATTVPTGNTRAVSLGDAKEVDFHFEDATIDNKPLSDEAFDLREEYEARVDYEIVFVEQDTVFFGDIDIDIYNGESAATRPISLDTQTQYTRVP